MSLPPLAILAGGMATRLGGLSARTPKALLDIGGQPFIHRQLALLKRQGLDRVLICAGHLGEQIQAAVGDGAAFGLQVEFAFDGPRLLGTGGALKQALPRLGEAFFVLYGDSYLEAEPAEAWRAFQASGLDALMTLYRNEGRWDASNVRFEDGRILAYQKGVQDPAFRHIDYGLGVIRAQALAAEPGDAFDLAGFYGRLLAQGRLAGLEVSRRFYEIGSLEGLQATREHLGGP